MLRLAVIGGGPSAACMVAAVARRVVAVSPVDITVFEPGPNLWRGQVFQCDGDEVLANVPMAEMSARTWDREHGVRWLHEQGLGAWAAESVFPSRSLVGRYLQDAAELAVTAMVAGGSQVRVEARAVQALVRDEGHLIAYGDGWRAGPFDHAVLCPGAPPSYDPYGLAGAAGYHRDPYPLRDSLADVPVRARVGIVGSGLTAVDVVMALRARGHQGPISLASRRGLLPAVRCAPGSHILQHLTVPNLLELSGRNGGLRAADVISLATAELAGAGADPAAIAADLSRTAPAARRLREDLDRARHDPDPGWTLLRDAMVSCGQDAWYLLRAEDKSRIRSWHQSLMRHCCPMPPGNAAALSDLFDTGQLDVLPGVTSIRPRPGGGFEIRAARDCTVDVLVSAATPATHRPAPMARQLVASLVAQGLAVPHPFGGLRVERTTSRLITSRGGPDPGLHALGDLTHGAYLFTFGMPVLAARADGIATDIATAVREAFV
ncbi:FAD/NAD(P)-binding protein [Krasilnikovia sp. MM14-A1004]|uniref:FAD/NAD(P)-binding protein n=1 Tax=Krasilnikovia sp. MM14-A1004 TaxID=3373541 RepID=UPI00399CB0E2